MKRSIILPKSGLYTCFLLTALSVSAQELAVNLALNKPAVASTLESPSYPASKATDGLESTFWSSGGSFAQNLYVDLGLTYEINKVVLKWADDRYASTLDIQVSDNATDWSTVITINPNTANPVTTITGISGMGRYVKFNGRGRGTGVRYRLAEMEVYGTAPQATTPEQQQAIDEITGKLLVKHIPETVNDGTIAGFSASMQANGSWTDIDYDDRSDTGWKPGAHLNRLTAMAGAYRAATSTFYESEALLEKIMLGIDYYYVRRPVSDNWWYNDIGGPQDYMVVLLLVKGDVDKTELLKYSSYLREQTARFAGGGKNLTWIAEISIYKGCIEDDFRITDIAFKAMASTLVVVSEQGAEGIKIDNSFHQHHEQLYSGGYGMSMVGDLGNYIELTGGNLFSESFSDDKRKILSDLMLDGHQLLGYRNVIDFGTMGRNISRTGARTNISADVLEKMITGDPDHAAAYQSWKNHLSGAPFPVIGNKHFWKSDIMTHHGANYYLSAKVISQRTLGTEALNGENIKAYNLPLGATNILTHSNEYANIYPIWDWSRIPGTTAEQSTEATLLDGYLYGTNDFGGGVSDGQSGLVAYEHNYRGVGAKKAYFFIGDALLCLGAGITADKENPVYTSVNQSYLSGPIHFDHGSGAQPLSQTSQDFSGLKWVHHDGVGYIFPDPASTTLQAVNQSGSWRQINGDGSSNAVNGDVFSLWFNHGNNPAVATYQYIVAPDKDLAAFQDYAGQHGFIVTQNTAEIQAVRNDGMGTYAVVFYSPGTADMGGGFSITSSGKALVLVKKTTSAYQLWVADPVYNQSSVTVTLRQNAMSENGRVTAREVTTEVMFPVADLTGKSVATTIPLSALPVALTNFSAKAETGVALLSWHTSSEQNSSHFEIEQSSNGKNFTKIGRVEALGHKDTASTYGFTDLHPVSGASYYRLRMVDQDGAFTYSRVVAIHQKDVAGLEIFPNPAGDFVKIPASRGGGELSVKVFSITGLLVKEHRLTSDKNQMMNITDLLSGIYILEIKDNESIRRSRFVKH